jgi:hypothetical protein
MFFFVSDNIGSNTKETDWAGGMQIQINKLLQLVKSMLLISTTQDSFHFTTVKGNHTC